ncbi:MAG: hypothetical protein CMJ87_09520 [Planctomycetes bacterium]|nr:hypothetical protein [Planctomycetota bacterium]
MTWAWGLLLVGPSLGLPQDSIEDLMSRSEVGAALATADQMTAHLDRTSWRVHVLHRAGWLDLALAEARDGLESFPADTNLLDQAGWLAASLSAAELTNDISRRMASVESDELAWTAKMERVAADGRRLSLGAADLRSGLRRAYLACATTLALVLVGLWRLGRS